MAGPHGSSRETKVFGDSIEGSADKNVLGTSTQGGARKLSDSGMSREDEGGEERKREEGGWSFSR